MTLASLCKVILIQKRGLLCAGGGKKKKEAISSHLPKQANEPKCQQQAKKAKLGMGLTGSERSPGLLGF